MPEVITIGETMVAFASKTPGLLRYAGELGMRIAGAESNLAIGVCKLGHTAGWISKVGNDELGQFVQNSIRSEGVDTSKIMFDAEYRTGVMFKQAHRSYETEVFYYRENSAASHMDTGMIPEEYLKSGKILHLTGITPVLSKTCEEMTLEAMKLAQASNVLVSFDPNIRRKLWKKDYSELLKSMTLQAQIVLIGLDEAEVLFGTTKIPEILGFLYQEGNADYVAIKNGSKGATVATQSETHFIPAFPCSSIDPIGAGDAFNAAFLCGILEGKGIEECGTMGAIAGALATETLGDTEGYPSREMMLSLLGGKKRISR